MNTALTTSLMLLAMAASGQAAITIFNQNNPLTGGSGNGIYRGFNVTFNDAALTTAYTAPHSAPMSATIDLTSMTVRRGTGSGGSAGVALAIYTSQSATVGSYIGISTNTNSMVGGTAANITFNFNNVVLSTSTDYYFYLVDSTSPTAFSTGRFNVSNAAGDTYSTGTLVNTSAGDQDTAYDAIFVATAVPEPSAAVLGGLGMFALLRRRRGI